jgi:hypothetical protein
VPDRCLYAYIIMARIVRVYECGVVADSLKPRALTEALNRLSIDNIDRFKKNSDCAARVHHADSNAVCFRDIVRGVIQEKKVMQRHRRSR